MQPPWPPIAAPPFCGGIEACFEDIARTVDEALPAGLDSCLQQVKDDLDRFGDFLNSVGGEGRSADSTS